MNQPVWIVKVGTNVLTDAHGAPDLEVFKRLVEAIAHVRRQGKRVIVVSSGAMGFGRSLLKGKKQAVRSEVAERQLFAAVGQVSLMTQYSEQFSLHDLRVAQVLATKQDFSDRDHYFNMRHCFTALLDHGVVPIVNENDVVAISELMFTDNDELAGLVASMMNAERLILLTNVDGVYSGEPGAANSKLLREIKITDQVVDIQTVGKSQFGRGGMQTKLTMARRLAKLGIQVHIANGKTPVVLRDILNDKLVGTVVRPAARRSNVKRRLSFSEAEATATVTVNAGAHERLISSSPVSILPIGITSISGTCQKGDVVRVQTEQGVPLGIGRSEYGSEALKSTIGLRNEKPFIHYDYLVIYGE